MKPIELFGLWAAPWHLTLQSRNQVNAKSLAARRAWIGPEGRTQPMIRRDYAVASKSSNQSRQLAVMSPRSSSICHLLEVLDQGKVSSPSASDFTNDAWDRADSPQSFRSKLRHCCPCGQMLSQPRTRPLRHDAGHPILDATLPGSAVLATTALGLHTPRDLLLRRPRRDGLGSVDSHADMR